MKSKSRREIIEDNKRLKKEIDSERARIRQRIFECEDRERKAQRSVDDANERMRRAGLDGGYEYWKDADKGTVIDYVTLNAHSIRMNGTLPTDEKEYVAHHLAERLAEQLINSGLVLLEYNGVDPRTGCLIISSRLDVIPWQMITNKTGKQTIAVFNGGMVRPW